MRMANTMNAPPPQATSFISGRMGPGSWLTVASAAPPSAGAAVAARGVASDVSVTVQPVIPSALIPEFESPGPLTVTVPAGAISATYDLPVVADAKAEPARKVSVKASQPPFSSRRSGAASTLTNQLRSLGYQTLTPGDAAAQTGNTVYYAAAFERLTLEQDVCCVQNPAVGTEFESVEFAEPQLSGKKAADTATAASSKPPGSLRKSSTRPLSCASCW